MAEKSLSQSFQKYARIGAMVKEIVAFSLTILSGLPAMFVPMLWQGSALPPFDSPIPKEEIVLSVKTAKNLPEKPPDTPTPTNTPTPTPTDTPTPTATPTPLPAGRQGVPTVTTSQDLESLFTKYADEYHIDKERLKHIAACESGFNTQANYNNLYLGMFQFSEGAWTTVRSSMGLSTDQELRKNAEESIRSAAFMLSRGQENAWPSCNN